MEFILERKYKKETYTIGNLTLNGEFICSTLEDKDYGFDQSTPVSKIKETKSAHPQQVAIPKGRYEISVKYYRGMSDRHAFYKRTSCKGHIPCLLNVPAYTGILIHCGTNAGHSAGCILVGKNTRKGQLSESKEMFCKVSDLIMNAVANNEKVYITII